MHNVDNAHQQFSIAEALRTAVQHHQAGQLPQAASLYQKILEAEPEHPDALHLLGVIAHQANQDRIAIDLIGKAIRIAPSRAPYHNNLAEAYRALNLLDEAAACYRTALSLDPGYAEAHNNLGVTLKDQGKLKEAVACYGKALSLNHPRSADVQWNQALALLLMGDYEAGLELHEKRFGLPEWISPFPQETLARLRAHSAWQGEDLNGKALLVWTEQGLGDSLMMMRYLPRLRDKGMEKLIVYCEPALVRMMKTLPGVDDVISRAQPLPASGFDCHCPIMSLPYRLQTRLSSIPNKVPYLMVPGEMKKKWADRLHGIDGFKVGIVWAGAKTMKKDALRSLPLGDFTPLAKILGVTLFTLQKGESAARPTDVDWPIVDWISECDDLLDTAALIDNLDLVVSVDTSVAHLAGALGKPVWLLNRFESEWRWMLEREDSPWYPTMRIIRQPARHDWTGAIKRVAEDISRGIQK